MIERFLKCTRTRMQTSMLAYWGGTSVILFILVVALFRGIEQTNDSSNDSHLNPHQSQRQRYVAKVPNIWLRDSVAKNNVREPPQGAFNVESRIVGGSPVTAGAYPAYALRRVRHYVDRH